MAMKKHATDAEVEARIEMVVTFLTQGMSVDSIRKGLVAKEGISLKQAGRYIQKAFDRISLFGSKPIDLEKGMLAQRMELLLSRALINKDLNLALEVTKSQLSLLKISYQQLQSGALQPHDQTPTSPQSEQPGLEDLLRLFEEEQSTSKSQRTA